MAGTKIGGQKSKNKLLANNPNHYKELGKKGGLGNKENNSFKVQICICDEYPSPHSLAQCAGKRGGKKSKRGKAIKKG